MRPRRVAAARGAFAPWLFVLLAVAPGFCPSTAHSAGTTAAGFVGPGLHAEQARVIANLPGTSTALLELVLVNDTGKPLQLLRITTPLAGAVSVHEMKMTGGVMQMRPAGSVSVPAHGRLEFRDGGLHLMLTALRRELRVGEAVPLQFAFDGGRALSVAAPVVAGQYVR